MISVHYYTDESDSVGEDALRHLLNMMSRLWWWTQALRMTAENGTWNIQAKEV